MGIIDSAIQRFGGLTKAELEDNRARRLPSPETKSIPSTTGGTSLDFGRVWLGGQLDIDELTRWSAYAYSVYAYAAMNYRATKISEPPLWVAQETEDGEEWLRDDPLQQVLDYPSPDFDMGYLRGMTSMYLDMDGEALWHLVRDAGGRVARIYPYAKEQFDVMSGQVAGTGDQRLYAKFRIQHASGAKLYGPEDVVYFREPSVELTGAVTSRLDAALKWANMGERVEESLKQAFKRGVLPFAVFSHPSDYNPDSETREANREMLESRYGGAENHGRPLMLYGGLSAQFANVDLSTLLPSEVLDRVEANVALAFGVRAEVLGFMVGLKNSPWSHMETARRITYEDTIEPYWRREEKALARQLLSEADRRERKFIRVDTDNVRALQEDEMRKSQIAMMNSDIWTADERRIYTGKEPLPVEENVPLAPDAGLNGAQISAAVEVLVRLRAENQAERISEIAAVELLVSLGVDRQRAEIMVRSEPSTKSALRQKSVSEKDAIWYDFDSKASAEEDEWEAAVLRLLTSQSVEVRTLARRILAGGVTAAAVTALSEAVERYLRGPARVQAAQALGPLVEATATSAARTVAGRIGFSFDVVQQGIERFAERETDFLVRVMGETTGDAVARTVQGAIEDRVGPDDLVKRLEELPAFDRQRATLVARTEITRSTNGAQREAVAEYAEQTGRRAMKTWISARDSRVRDEHIELDDDEWYDIDHVFANGLLEPGEPNCRCTMGYKTEAAS
jgi:HK97 family phage portal protein